MTWCKTIPALTATFKESKREDIGILKEVNGIDSYIVEFNKKRLLIEFDKNIINEEKIKNKIPEKFSLTEKSDI